MCFDASSTVDIGSMVGYCEAHFRLRFYFESKGRCTTLGSYRSASLEGLRFREGTSFTDIGVTGITYGKLKLPFSVSSYGSVVRGTCVLGEFVYISNLQPSPRIVSGLFGRLILFDTETT